MYKSLLDQHTTATNLTLRKENYMEPKNNLVTCSLSEASYAPNLFASIESIFS